MTATDTRACSRREHSLLGRASPPGRRRRAIAAARGGTAGAFGVVPLGKLAGRQRGQGRPGRACWLVAVAAGLAVLAACSTTPTAGSAGSVAAGSSRYQKALAYAQCMRSHGIANFPDPNSEGRLLISNQVVNGASNGVNSDSPQFLSANKTCAKLLPNGGQPTAAQQQQQMSALLKLAECMRSHGIPNFPDPTADGSGASFNLIGSGIGPALLQSVMQTCMKLTHFGQGTS